jgi:diaminopimelate epimerase
MIFYKLHALSNDFIFFKKKHIKEIDIISVCNRNTGIGADGIVFYEIIEDIMYIQLFNKDGSVAKNPGNAFFCAAKLWSVIDENKLQGKILSDDIVFEYKKIF